MVVPYGISRDHQSGHWNRWHLPVGIWHLAFGIWSFGIRHLPLAFNLTLQLVGISYRQVAKQKKVNCVLVKSKTNSSLVCLFNRCCGTERTWRCNHRCCPCSQCRWSCLPRTSELGTGIGCAGSANHQQWCLHQILRPLRQHPRRNAQVTMASTQLTPLQDHGRPRTCCHTFSKSNHRYMT